MKKTLVLGASTNPERYSFKAAHRLSQHGHNPVLLGRQEGEVAGRKILTGKPELTDIDTVTLYVGPRNQTEWTEYLIKMKPRRVIFNPGAENPELEKKLAEHGIETIEACTLVMLSVGNY